MKKNLETYSSLVNVYSPYVYSTRRMTRRTLVIYLMRLIKLRSISGVERLIRRKPAFSCGVPAPLRVSSFFATLLLTPLHSSCVAEYLYCNCFRNQVTSLPAAVAATDHEQPVAIARALGAASVRHGRRGPHGARGGRLRAPEQPHRAATRFAAPVRTGPDLTPHRLLRTDAFPPLQRRTVRARTTRGYAGRQRAPTRRPTCAARTSFPASAPNVSSRVLASPRATPSPSLTIPFARSVRAQGMRRGGRLVPAPWDRSTLVQLHHLREARGCKYSEARGGFTPQPSVTLILRAQDVSDIIAVYEAGYGVSLVALLISLAILLYFR